MGRIGLIVVGLGCLAARGTILPANRVIDWSTAGTNVPSASWPVWTNVAPVAGDMNATLQWCANNCPAGQVIKLLPGYFTNGTKLQITRTNIVFRGSGPGATTNVFTGSLAAVEFLPAGGEYPRNNSNPVEKSADLVSGYTAGSTTLVANAGQFDSDLVVGAMVIIDQVNDGTNYPTSLWDMSFVTKFGDYQDGSYQCTYCSRQNGDRLLNQVAVVTGISGGTITIDTPLYWTYSAGLAPQISWWSSPPTATGCGIEDMTIDCRQATGNGQNHLVQFYYANRCWGRNVTTILGDRGHVNFKGSLHCVWRDSYIYLSKSNASQNYGVEHNDGACANLTENCRFNAVGAPIIFGAQVTGNVAAYNYATNVLASPTTWEPEALSIHDGHVEFNLLEGNYFPSCGSDEIHGSSSHNTIFRNNLPAKQTMGWGGSTATTSGNVYSILMNAKCRSNNVVANILGTAGFSDTYMVTNGSANCGGAFAVYRMGFHNICSVDTVTNGCPGSCNAYDTNVVQSTLIHGNWDAVSGGIVWDPSIADHAPPPSLYLASKPSWFGDRPWPAFDPASTTAAAIDPTNLPAAATFLLGWTPGAAPPDPGPAPAAVRVVNFSSVTTNAP